MEERYVERMFTKTLIEVIPNISLSDEFSILFILLE